MVSVSVWSGYRSGSWPEVQGTIVSSHVAEDTGSDAPYYPEVVYRYEVGGRKYTSSRRSFETEMHSSSRGSADSIVKRYPAGKSVPVYVDPGNAAEAVLARGVPPVSTMILLLLLAMPPFLISYAVNERRAGRVRMSKPPVRAAVFRETPLRPEELNAAERVVCRAESGAKDEQWVVQSLLAALRAMEKAGMVEFQTKENGLLKKSRVIDVVPSGRKPVRPPYTLEARLRVRTPRRVSDVVYEWLEEDCSKPFQRAAEQLRVMAVLRGFGRLDWNPKSGRGYSISEEFRQLPVADESDEDLEREIRNAFDRRTRYQDNPHGGRTEIPGSDPWLAESELDRTRLNLSDEERATVFAAKPDTKGAGSLGLGIAGFIGMFLLVAFHAEEANPLPLFAAVSGVAAVLGFGVPLIPGLGRIQLGTARLCHSCFGKALPENAGKRMQSAMAAPVFGAAAAAAQLYPRIGAVIAAGIGIGLLARALRRKVAAAVTAHVVASAEPSNQSPAQAEAATVEAAGPAVSERGVAPIEYLEADSLPPVSAESRERIRAILERGPALTKIYRESALALATATTGLSVLMWLLAPRLPGSDEPGFPYVLVFLAVATWLTVKMTSVMTALAGALIKPVVNSLAGVKSRTEPVRAGMAVRLTLLPLLGYGWIFLAAAKASPFAPPVTRAVAFVVFWGLCAAYVFRVRARVREVEQRYPARPPLNLLALRVFNSNSMDNFLTLTDLWQWIGTRQKLDGPDTAGERLKDVGLFLVGRLDLGIVENDQEVAEAFARLRTAPDPTDLRFPMNSMQCTDATWKQCLFQLLDRCDVVLMDLSGFTPQNRGCVFEIRQLAQRMPVGRVILLVGDSTDVEFLRAVVADAWKGKATVRVLYTGGDLERRETESVYEWKDRVEGRLKSEQLVGTLLDSALPQRSQAGPPKHYAGVMPRQIGRLVHGVLILALSIMLLFSVVNLFSEHVVGPMPPLETPVQRP